MVASVTDVVELDHRHLRVPESRAVAQAAAAGVDEWEKC
jgi:hypothetical protein